MSQSLLEKRCKAKKHVLEAINDLIEFSMEVNLDGSVPDRVEPWVFPGAGSVDVFFHPKGSEDPKDTQLYSLRYAEDHPENFKEWTFDDLAQSREFVEDVYKTIELLKREVYCSE